MSLAVLASRVTGLVREMVMAHLFGAGQIFDAFVLGFRIPNLTRDLFAEGALSSAFIPTLTRYRQDKSHAEATRLVNLVATAVFVLVGVVCVAGVIFSPQLVDLLAPGYRHVPGKYELAVRMTRIMFPFLLLVALAAQVMAVLNVCNQYGVPALASTLFNVGSVASGVLLGFWLGAALGISPIEGMAWGVVFGGALQLLWQLPSLYRQGFALKPSFDPQHPGLRHVFRLMGPAVLGSAAVQINVMVNTSFASRISDPVRGFDGPVSWLGFAFRFMQLPLGLFGVAIASATLPAISRSFSGGNLDEFRNTLSRSIGLTFLLTLPSSAGLAILGESITGAIYQGGKFQAYDTRQTAAALSCYAIGLSGYAALKVLTPAFYALGDARTPMLVSLASIAINYGASSLMVDVAGWGHQSLALSTSSVALFGFLLLFGLLRKRIAGLYGRNLLSSTLRILAATIVMAAGVALSNSLLLDWLGHGRFAHAVNLAVSIPAGLALFYWTAKAFKVVELEIASNAVGSVLARSSQTE